MRRAVLTLTLVALLATPATAGAHIPGTYGGKPERVCGTGAGGMIVVGATDVSCRIARKVATTMVRQGKRYRRFRNCPGARKGSAYGHCHGRGLRRGAIVHWGLND